MSVSTDCSKVVGLLLIYFAIHHVCLYYAILSVLGSFVIACWERIELLALMCGMFPCVFFFFFFFLQFPIWCLGLAVVLSNIVS